MTTDNFHVFAKAVRAQFDTMAKSGKLFVADTDRDDIWTTYLASFPAGTNPLFRERTEHDCACCRGFIRNVGNVVALIDGVTVTVWHVSGMPSPYQEVADAMAAYVVSRPIHDIYLTKWARQGTEKSIELIDGRTHQWNHFSVNVPLQFVTMQPDEVRGNARTMHSVLLRGVRELTPAAVATVMELIKDNAIYRGAEFAKAVKAFAALQARFLGINDPDVQSRLAWQLLGESVGVARFRNTVIGTLVQDLSEGKDLEAAVRIYESKVAPHNYKRTTALITKRMVDDAMVTITELGLEDALERRHARLSDVSVNSVLFVDNAVQGEMKGGLKNLLMEEVKPAVFNPKVAEEITITDFISKLPAFTGLQVYLEAQHQANFVSLTAPVHPDVKPIFAWDNNFAWSYDGNVTDSIKEKVKRAGGRVENVALRVSLAWHNHDDLDLHCKDPRGRHIYYASPYDTLDVDMNAGYGTTREPVENMRWVNLTQDGVYTFWVHQFNRRESIDVGYEVEIETLGGVTTLSCAKSPPNRYEHVVAQVHVKNGHATVKPGEGMVVGHRSQEKWGVKTLALTRVNALVLSPNYWDGQEIGNKHWFFILDGCKNPEPTRGLYNEFLGARLMKHRKVFEVLGDKTKCPPAPDQLSGIGFSSTRQAELTVLATGPNIRKVYSIHFGT